MKYSSFDSQVRKSNRICGGGCRAQRAGRYQKSIFSIAVIGGIAVELWKATFVAAQIVDIEVDCCIGLWFKEPNPGLFSDTRVTKLVGEASDADFPISDQGLDTL